MGSSSQLSEAIRVSGPLPAYSTRESGQRHMFYSWWSWHLKQRKFCNTMEKSISKLKTLPSTRCTNFRSNESSQDAAGRSYQEQQCSEQAKREKNLQHRNKFCYLWSSYIYVRAAQKQLFPSALLFEWQSCCCHCCRKSNLQIQNEFKCLSWRSGTDWARPHPTLQQLSQDPLSVLIITQSWSICQSKWSQCQPRYLQHLRAFFTSWSHSYMNLAVEALETLWERDFVCLPWILGPRQWCCSPATFFPVLLACSSPLSSHLAVWWLKFPLNWSNVFTQGETLSTNPQSLWGYFLLLQKFYKALLALISSSA